MDDNETVEVQWFVPPTNDVSVIMHPLAMYGASGFSHETTRFIEALTGDELVVLLENSDGEELLARFQIAQFDVASEHLPCISGS